MIILKRQHGFWIACNGSEVVHAFARDHRPAADMIASARCLWPDALIGVEPADGPVVWMTDNRLDYGPLLVDTR